MKNIRYAVFLIAAAVIIVSVFAVELHYMGLGKMPTATKFLLFVLFNLNITALLTLMFFVGKSLLRLYLERKHRVLGYRLKTKFVVILVVLTMIPSAFLLVVSSGVMTNYLDRWFDPQIRQPLNRAVDIATSVYELQRQQTLRYAVSVASGTPVSENYRIKKIAEMPDDASETVREGFEGKAGAEVVSREDGDFVVAVVPVYEENDVKGIVLVESPMGGNISRNAEDIRTAYKDYLEMESWKTPIKTNYILILSFFTLLIVFMALWVGLRISRGITDPIQTLAQSTEKVAKGDLDVRVDIRREDEIGLLVDSFNRMVAELKEGKESLQRAWTESDRRRLIIENILGNINSGVISIDTSGNIITVNNSACEILDIKPEDILNKNYSVLLSILGSEELKDAVRKIRLSYFRKLEKEVNAAIGERRAVLRVFITSIRDSDNFLGTLVVFDDITGVVRVQKAMAWEEVARRIAHEIKNPLTPIKLSTDHMIKKWERGDSDFGQVFERSTRTISREVESLKRLVDEFSRFGKMPEIRKTTAVVSDIVDSVANLYRDYKGLEIVLSRQEDEPPAEVDVEQFKRVIINIVENAIQAMDGKGIIKISVSYDTEEQMMYVEIADNGPGIREEDKEKLFLPYFSTKKDGTGLGLAIASRVINEHRGHISVRDNKTGGTIFSVGLPVKEG